MQYPQAKITHFKNTIWDYYNKNQRPFSWRHVNDPYKVVVSEIMLQQTQTQRVAEKYEIFIQRFPSFETLAQATLQEVLLYWQGLGYNRRGKYLHQIAQKVMNEYAGKLPADPTTLNQFPGIGAATAASICTFAFTMPTVFIETNIRTVYIHFFFKNKTGIHDKEIMPLIKETVEQTDARNWYYALMDYGVMLKKSMPNPSRKSAHHAKQSTFEGSDRQIRGKIIKELTQSSGLDFNQLCSLINKEPVRIARALDQLQKEQLIEVRSSIITIK